MGCGDILSFIIGGVMFLLYWKAEKGGNNRNYEQHGSDCLDHPYFLNQAMNSETVSSLVVSSNGREALRMGLMVNTGSLGMKRMTHYVQWW